MSFILSNISIPQDCFLHRLTKLHGRQVWKDNKGRLYTWDRLHGHVEKFDKTGKKYLCVMDKNGEVIEGPSLDGRNISDNL